jgi:hypothetical protein
LGNLLTIFNKNKIYVGRLFKNHRIKMTTADERTWYIIPCPSSVALTHVDKERGTHGSIYVLWDIDEKSPVWVGQSVPALVRSVNEKAVINKEKRLHASSLYRCLRGEARKQHHKSWKVDKYSRDSLEQMNKFLSDFPSVVYVSKSPELWKCRQQEEPQQPEGDASGSAPDGAPGTPPSTTHQGGGDDGAEESEVVPEATGDEHEGDSRQLEASVPGSLGAGAGIPMPEPTNVVTTTLATSTSLLPLSAGAATTTTA